MTESITSLQNPRIKNIVKLQEKSSERRKQNLVVIEGAREIGLALEAGLVIGQLYVCDELYGEKEVLPARQVFHISKEVFDKIAYRENSDGLIALAVPAYVLLEDLQLPENPLIVILESVEKPGNLGAILRTMDASQADVLIVCDPKTDIYNPNAIRSSVGCVFTTRIVISTTEEVQAWLKRKGITSYAAALSATRFYQDTDFRKACAIVMGTEATGLSDAWLENADMQIKIPMRGKIDSLNVATSTAILVFEAMRQRGF